MILSMEPEEHYLMIKPTLLFLVLEDPSKINMPTCQGLPRGLLLMLVGEEHLLV